MENRVLQTKITFYTAQFYYQVRILLCIKNTFEKRSGLLLNYSRSPTPALGVLFL